jgi:arabinose-5-phosphate isomerase
MKDNEIIAQAIGVFRRESIELEKISKRLDRNFVQAIRLILESSGRHVMVTGIGKSGKIAEKIVATLCSTGTPAIYVHGMDAIHGDLGVYTPGDSTIVLSKSGTTKELVQLIPILRKQESPIIGILGTVNSVIGGIVDVVLDVHVSKEADTLGIVPTSSTTAALAMGDTLAVVLMSMKNITEEQFSRFHPGGQLGRHVRKLREIMNPDPPVVYSQATFLDVIDLLTKSALGAVCVVNNGNELLGIITDGDVRRTLLTNELSVGIFAEDIMTKNPVTIRLNSTVNDAIQLMEGRISQISVLPVIDEQRKCIGIVRIHDVFQAGLLN